MGRIVHIGLGNFARAHLLDYTADAGGWDVVGVSLRSAAIRDGLAKQGFEYDLCVQGQTPKRIQILQDVLVAHEDPAAVLMAMGKADIISATVTEKGYCLKADGTLDLEHPGIQRDLHRSGPETLIGLLAHALSGRTTPVTVLSCDNRVENGATLKAAVEAFAASANLVLPDALASFPNAMVDRITPATTDAVRAISGDPMAVPTEAFREWVIEDAFAGPRPDWPGVQFVDDVAPHELRKLRMLNGAHSLMAYAGLARGHRYVHDAISDPELGTLVKNLMKEAGATLPEDIRDQVPAYADALTERFKNPHLQHRLDQIAMDGSQKVPYRFAATLRSGPAPSVAAGLKAWMDWCVSETRAGRSLDDPKAAGIAIAAASDNPEQALLELVGASDLASVIQA